MSSQNIHLYLTSEHDCGYLPGRLSTNLVPDPRLAMNMALYSRLITLGYRRSGDYTYRPHCKECSACVPCRIPVTTFRPRRNQRRCLKANDDLDISLDRAHYNRECFELYRRYVNSRHANSDMVNPGPDDFRNFLYSDWSDTWFLQARLAGRLLSVLVYDRVDDGLSAVYSFFEPGFERRSLGTFNILQLVARTRVLELEHVYMGYMIDGCNKMQYKSGFHPMEFFSGNRWERRHAST